MVQSMVNKKMRLTLIHSFPLKKRKRLSEYDSARVKLATVDRKSSNHSHLSELNSVTMLRCLHALSRLGMLSPKLQEMVLRL